MNAWADKVLLDPVESFADVGEAQNVGTVSPPCSGQGRGKNKKGPGSARDYAPFRRVEAEFGKPIQEVCQDLAARGFSRNQAARELGIPESTFKGRLIQHEIQADWPKINQSYARKEALKSVSAKARNRWIGKGAVMVNGETMGDIARRCGLTTSVVLSRYRRGDRSMARLGRPPTYGSRKKFYRVGIDMMDWQIVIDYVEAKISSGLRPSRARDAARRKFGVPVGAISAMQNGEWWRIT